MTQVSERSDPDFRSGFVTVVGRPNVGKSTLVNAIVGQKVSITAKTPNTTRNEVRAVLHRPGVQAVFVDTPGLHRPRSALGERLNEHVSDALEDVDVVTAVLDATAPIGRGDHLVLERAAHAVRQRAADQTASLLVAVNKVDRASRQEALVHLAGAQQFLQESGSVERIDYFPVSASTGEGLEELVGAITKALPEGPPYYPSGQLTDTPEATWVAELVREQLLARVRDELPHSIACRVSEWEWPVIRVEIIVERDSQKGIVIGRDGEVLKDVGTAVRHQLQPGAFLELHVRVDKGWQRRPDAVDRLGY